MSGIAGAADNAPQAMPQSAAQPKAMDASSGMGAHSSLMGKKHNFVASDKASPHKDKAHGWVAPAKPSKPNSKNS
ncbi:MAG TPA: hypothetical protein VKG44_03155 [Candidatus Baltobacteraceae bacterium]|nr:hypothetical protein [Candidatus Baltobacteraceae bacterium]